MAFSFKFPKVGGSGDTGAPMTVSADVDAGQGACAVHSWRGSRSSSR